MTIIECVPNFSEGRDQGTIAELALAAGSVHGAALLDQTSDRDHNRTVLTIAGSAEAVAEAAFRAVTQAVERINIRVHEGVHPRVGAADVVPFVPVTNASLELCTEIANQVAERIFNELGVPVYLYEAAARHPERARLEVLRSPKFTGDPDIGNGRHPTAGVSIVGARRFLVAWNINLHSQDLDAARAIARAVRQSSGGLPAVKSIGLELKSRGQVQVSINLVDFETTPLHLVFDRVRAEAEARGIEMAGSELIGLIPRKALELSAGHDLRWLIGDRIEDYVLEDRIAAARL
jgi:glutamate formiminotransferase